LRALHLEKTEKDEKAELKVKKREKMRNDNKTEDEIKAEISEDEEVKVEVSDDPFNKSIPVDKYEELKHWDFPVDSMNHDIFEYNVKE